MTVTLKLFQTLFILFFSIQEIHSKIRCDERLLSTFQLRGLKFASRSKMEICPHVQERCCTLMDQVAIIKLWKQHGQVATRLYSDTFYIAMKSFFSYIHYLVESLNEEDITVHYAKHKWIPYLKNYCFYRKLPILPETEADRIKAVFPGKGMMQEFDKFQVKPSPFDKEIKQKSDQIAVKLYLAFLAFSVFKNKKKFKIYESLYYDEKNLKTLNLKSLHFQSINLNNEKVNFLKFINIATLKVFDTFDDQITKYEKRLNPLKINEIQKNFQLGYKGMLKEIKDFMKYYNKIAVPTQRLEMLRAFAQHIKKKTISMISFIYKLSILMKKSVKEQKAINKRQGSSLMKKLEKQQKNQSSSPTINSLASSFAESDIFQSERAMDPSSDLNKTITKDQFTQKSVAQQQAGSSLPIDSLFPPRKLKQKLRKKKKGRRRGKKRKGRKSANIKGAMFWKMLIKSVQNLPFKMKKIISVFSYKKYQKKYAKFYKKKQGEKSFEQLKREREQKMKEKKDELESSLLWKLARQFYLKEFKKQYKGIILPSFKLPSTYTEPLPPQIPLSTIQKQQTYCEVKGKYFFRTFMVMNKEKINLKEIDVDFVIKSINLTKVSNMSILELKKTVYCFVCDVHKQRNFVNDKKIVIFEQKFCEDLISSHKDYLYWINVYIIELMDQISQAMKCFETNGDEFRFPFKSKIDNFKKKSFFIKRCLENYESPDMGFYCSLLCRDFQFYGFSKYWDGNLKLIQEMIFYFNTFTRRMGLQSSKVQEPVVPINLLMMFSVDRNKDNSIQKGVGFTEEEKRKQKIQGEVFQLNKEAMEMGSKPQDVKSDRAQKPSSFADKIPKIDKTKTQKYQQQCKQCPSGNSGEDCRLKYCSQPSPCQRCIEGPEGNQCRLRYCDFYKQLKSQFSSKPLDVSKGTDKPKIRKDDPDLIPILKNYEPIEYKFDPVYEREKINERLKTNRILEEGNSQNVQIFQRRQPYYNIKKYRTFYSQKFPAINPLQIFNLMRFDKVDIQDLLRQQYRKSMGEVITGKIMKYYLDANKKELKDFKQDVLRKFGEVTKVKVVRTLLTKKQRRRKMYKKFMKKLVKNKLAMELYRPNKNLKFRRPKMPAHEYLLNDIGKDSNDSITKYLAAKLHNVKKDQEDPRDWQKPYVPPLVAKLMKKEIQEEKELFKPDNKLVD